MNPFPRVICLALAVFGAAANAAETEAPAPSIERCAGAWGSIFQQSHSAKKGVTLLVGGEKLGGLVIGCTTTGTVELKSQEYGRIVVLIDRIDAAAMP